MRVYAAGRWRSLVCAFKGIADLVKSQRNAHIHLVATLATCAAAIAFRVSAGEWCWLLAAMGAVWVAEALNTAVELVADAAVPQRHPLIGRAKDVAAGGVLMASLMAAGIGCCVFGPHMQG